MPTNSMKTINILCLASPGIRIWGHNHCVVSGDHNQSHQTHQYNRDPHHTPNYTLRSHRLHDSGIHMTSDICLDPHLTYQQQEYGV